MNLIEHWHPYWNWEEVKFNMWGDVDNKKDWLQKAIEFTGNHKLYGSWMLKVANDWVKSCEHNLTKVGTNKKAWIGHAAVAYAIQCPEDIVRAAWSYLTEEQQILANNEALNAIKYWENKMITVSELKRESENFYQLMGKYFGSRQVAKEVGINVYDDYDKTWFVAYDNNLMCGFASVRKGLISDCYVLPEKRNKGVFRNLLTFIEISTQGKLKANSTNASYKAFKNAGFKEIRKTKNFRYMEMNRA